MKTRLPGKIPREDATLVQGARTPAGEDTTSEPWGRNAPPGAPVIAPMSGLARGNQGGTVEYFVSHPCIVRGWDYFYTLPKLGNEECKMQNSKLRCAFGTNEIIREADTAIWHSAFSTLHYRYSK